MLSRLREYAQLMRLHRPIGIYLLLWPTLWAVWIAGNGFPALDIIVIFTLGVVLMRSAGCVINDYADRDFDPHVARTRDRPIAAGRVTPREALRLFVVLCVLAFVLVLQLNWLTIALSLGAVALATVYPFMKRHTHWPQAVLGAAFAWSIPMAFAAQTHNVPWLAWWLFATALAWTVMYDTLYAMADREEDTRIGVKSTAILFGHHDRLITALLQLGVLASLAGLGGHLHFGVLYFAALAVVALLFGYQQWLIRHRQPQPCFQAFVNNQWVGAAVFIGIVAAYAQEAGCISL